MPVPFLALVHLRELHCAQCGELLAAAGARSFIVDQVGEAVPFASDHPPTEIATAITCSAGHESVLYIPNEIAAEGILNTPEGAPIGRDAVVRPDVP